MRASGLVNTLLAFVLLFTTVSASWWSPLEENALVGRQNDDDNTSSGNNDNDQTTSGDSASRTATDEDSSASASNSDSQETDSESASGTGSRSGSGSRTTSSRTRTTNVDPRLPAGGVELITPAATACSQYYKVGDTITFEWNYTSLSNTPSAIDIFATCSLNQATYTISSNMSVEETGKVLWDTGDSANVSAPFPVATYTLFIHDAARDPTQVASAGDLGVFNQFRFGMYTPQPYTPLNEFKCSTCSAALSLYEQQALGVLGVTAVVTVLSFSWFANGFGLLG